MSSESDAAITKHSLLIAGHQTSISLEAIFWDALKREAARRSLSIAALVAEIDAGRDEANLSSAIRVHLFRLALAEDKPVEQFRTQKADALSIR